MQVNVVNYASSENWRFLITEILPNPEIVSDAEGEFIEITNSFPFDLLISNWRIGDDGDEFVFNENTIIQKYSSIIIARSSAGFLTGYGKTADFELGMTLSNTGDVIRLQNQNNIDMDVVAYGSKSSTDGSTSLDAPDSGISLQRSPLHIDTNNAEDFVFASPDPKGSIPGIELLLTGSTDTEETDGFSSMLFISSIIFVVYTIRRRRERLNWKN